MSNPLTLLKTSSTVPSANAEPPQEEQAHLPFALEIFREMMNDPEQLCCSLSLTLFEEPVIDGVGHTYEKRYIREHFESQKKQAFLTSPLSGEVVDNDHVVLNRSKKSEVEEYKIQKANKCFDLAQQCIQKKCGDTALILINRVSQLNPKKEGLKQIEAVAQETFISISQQKKSCRLRAEALIQANRAEEALRFLKPLEEKPIYEFSLANKTALPIFKSYFRALSSDCKYLTTAEGGYSGPCSVWDIEKKPQVIFHDFPIDNLVFTTKNIATFKSSYSDDLFQYHFFTKKIDKFDSCRMFGLVRHTNRDRYCGREDSINGSLQIRVVNSERGAIGIIVTQPVSTRNKVGGYVPDTDVANFNRIALVHLSGYVEVIKGDKEGFSSDRFGGHTITDYEKVTDYFKINTMTRRDTWNGRWPSFGNDHPAAALTPPYGEKAGLYRNRMVARMGRPHPLNDKLGEEQFFTYKINYTYKNTGDIELYQTLLKAAVLANDFETYLNAIEHLIGFHQQNRSWKALEELVLSLSGHSAPIREKIVQAIKEAETGDDNFWTSRLYLLLGLFQKPLPLKKDAYKRALQLNSDDPAAVSALEFVKALKLDQALLTRPETVDTSEVQELKARMQKQQEQIDKLQELVDRLLAKK